MFRVEEVSSITDWIVISEGLSDVLISSLPSLKALQEVIGGDNGILKCDKDSQILIDTTTLKVEDKIALGELMSAGGKVFLDAPISGTPPMVEALQGSLYVSGDEAAYERCKPIIEGFTKTNY